MATFANSGFEASNENYQPWVYRDFTSGSVPGELSTAANPLVPPHEGTNAL